MHAKEDVLSRLGGTSMNSSTSNSTVRIGYGKPDSSSSSSPSNNFNNNNNNPGLIRSMSGGNYSPDFNNQNGGGMIGMGMMSSSAPTRALWIGSIPNTTTPAHLMMLFSPFGQIESARVLTHKSCGVSIFPSLPSFRVSYLLHTLVHQFRKSRRCSLSSKCFKW